MSKIIAIFMLQVTTRYWHNLNINVWNFNEMLTNDVVSFEQTDPDLVLYCLHCILHHFDESLHLKNLF